MLIQKFSLKLLKILALKLIIRGMQTIRVSICPWPKVTQISKLKLVFSDTLGKCVTNFYMKAYRRMRTKFFIKELGHMTKMAAMPIFGIKTFKNLLQNQLADDF